MSTHETTDAVGVPDPVISVRGEAILEVEAEIAHLVVNVNGRDRKRGAALRALEARSAAVLAVAGSFGPAV
jgi:uncharacterized protein